MRLTKPLITVLRGAPPIAWIVLAMIWFGGSDATVRTVIVVSAIPVVFLGAAQGIITLDRGLDRMAEACGPGWSEIAGLHGAMMGGHGLGVYAVYCITGLIHSARAPGLSPLVGIGEQVS